MSDSFQPLGNSFTPDPTQSQVQQQDQSIHPADMLMNFYKNSIQPVLSAGAQVAGYPLEKIAQVGRLADKGNQQLMSGAAEQMGRAGVNPYVSAAITTPYATLSKALMPQDKLSAALTLMAAGAGKGSGVVAEQPVAQAIPVAGGSSPLSQGAAQSGVLGSSTASISPEAQLVKTQADSLIQQEAAKRGVPADSQFVTKLGADLHNKINGIMGQIGNELSQFKTPAEKEAYLSNYESNPLKQKGNELGIQFQKLFQAYPNEINAIPHSAEESSKLLEGFNDIQKSSQATSSVATNKPGAMAQLMMARAKITPNMGQYAIDHPEVLGSDTPSVAQATKQYANAVGGLKDKVSDLATTLNKTVIRNSDYDNAIDEAGRLLKSGPGPESQLTPQKALTGVQSINQALRNKSYTSGMSGDQIREISKVKDGLLDFLQNNGSPDIREAGKTLFEAHVKEAFSDWMPKNKFGSPDALRSMAGMGQLGTAGALAAAGHPLAAIPIAANAALSSPRVWGAGIRAAGQMSMPGQGMMGQAAGQLAPYIPNMLSNMGGQQ